jgi:hypothetical protein
MDKTIEIAPHLAGGVSAFKHDRSVIDVAFFGFESYWGTPTARPHSFRSEKKKKGWSAMLDVGLGWAR